MEFLFEVMQAITNIFVIFGVIITLKQLIMSRKIAAADLERRKKEATVTFTCEVLSQLDVLKTSLENYGTITYKEYIANKELQGVIKQYLRLLERMSVGINTGIYDFDVFQRICGYRVWKRWCDFQPIIYEMRKKKQSNNLYIEYEQIANRLKKYYTPKAPSNGDIKNKL